MCVSVWLESQSLNKVVFGAVVFSPSSPEPNSGDASKLRLGIKMETARTAASPPPQPAVPPPIAVPPLHPFLEHPGEPLEAWPHWLTKFENHWAMVTLGRAGVYTPQEKSRYLLLLLGTEGQRLVRHLPAVAAIDTLRHDEFVTALKTILVPRSSPFRALAALMGRRQRMGETVHQYVADLRDLASRCPLPPGQEDFWVASILAIGCVSDKARERLFTLPEVDLVRVPGDRSASVG